ncbi:NHL repeat-containing protein [Streptomyces sp. NPDC021622]|uniref:NHL repeat-containing protein n=1 Tax=Streptomyces sp. NPDC021622 TaxID=3155013 RepID=UPI0033FC5C25
MSELEGTSTAAREASIFTVAGDGTDDSYGDDGPAVKAALYRPLGTALDSDGNLYIADTENDRVRRVDAQTETITTVAGNGNRGFGGDDGLAIEAALNAPTRIALDSDGNLYIADSGNNRVRRVDAQTQTITTVAGHYHGDYFAGDGGPAVEAYLVRPNGVAVDSEGNLFIADTKNNRVRRVDAATQTITTVAGNGNEGYGGDDGPAVEAALNFPRDVAVDSEGNLYIADQWNRRVRRVDAATQTITTVAGDGSSGFAGDDGPAVKARLDRPTGVAVDSEGNLYIADTENHRVRRVDAVTETITTVAGDGTEAFAGDGGPAVEAALDTPGDVVVGSGGSLYIADTDNNRIRKVEGVPAPARFSVSPGGPVTLVRAGASGYAGVVLQNVGDGDVPSQKVRVTLPQGLQFTSDRLVVGVMQGTQWKEMGSYQGTLTPDGRTLAFQRVDLALPSKGAKSGALVEVNASADAPLGDSTLGFRVGGQTSRSSTIHVVAQ